MTSSHAVARRWLWPTAASSSSVQPGTADFAAFESPTAAEADQVADSVQASGVVQGANQASLGRRRRQGSRYAPSRTPPIRTGRTVGPLPSASACTAGRPDCAASACSRSIRGRSTNSPGGCARLGSTATSPGSASNGASAPGRSCAPTETTRSGARPAIGSGSSSDSSSPRRDATIVQGICLVTRAPARSRFGCGPTGTWDLGLRGSRRAAAPPRSAAAQGPRRGARGAGRSRRAMPRPAVRRRPNRARVRRG